MESEEEEEPASSGTSQHSLQEHHSNGGPSDAARGHGASNRSVSGDGGSPSSSDEGLRHRVEVGARKDECTVMCVYAYIC